MVLLLLRSICNQVFEVENMLVTGSSLWAAGGGSVYKHVILIHIIQYRQTLSAVGKCFGAVYFSR